MCWTVTEMTHDAEHAVGVRPVHLAHHVSVGEEHNTVRVCGCDRIVGHHDDRLTERGHRMAEKVQQVGAGFRIEVPRRLVGEDDLRLTRQRPRGGDALLLATGELIGPVFEPVAEAGDANHLGKRRGIRFAARDRQWEDDVVVSGERRHEVERLEDEADALAAQQRELPVAQAAQLDVADVHGARRQTVETGQAVQQGRFARTRRSHDRAELSLRKRDGDAVQCAHLCIAAPVDLYRVGGSGRHRECL
jgi:hypothetical protein